MSLKFCPNCEAKLNGNQNFCTKCGYDLTRDQIERNDVSTSNQQSQPQPQNPEANLDMHTQSPINVRGYSLNRDQSKPNEKTVSDQKPKPEPEPQEIQGPDIDLDVPAPSPNGAGGVNRDYKEDRVIQYKSLMGMNTGVQNTVSGEVYSDGPKLGFSSVLAELSARWFILSFEDEGIVLIGVDKFGHFNEKNSFFSKDIVKSVNIYHNLGKKNLVFNIFSGEKFQFYINYALLGCPYQRKNYKNLANLVSKYNK